MKKITYLLFASVFALVSCTEDFDFEDRDQRVSELPGYVAFNAPGASVTVADVDTDEEGNDEDGDTLLNADGFIALNVEIPTGNLSDITVNYSISGSAVFGVDYTIAGATATGGTITIVHDPEDFLFFDNEDIEIQLLTDGVSDGDKTIIITLTSASNAEGDVAVGRGGTDILATQSVNILDVDYVTVSASPASVDEDNAGEPEEEDRAKFVFEGKSDDRTAPVDVEYSLGGTAVFGVDYTIVGASATGGTITIPLPAGDDPMTIELDVEILTDGVVDGEKTIIATLVSANDGTVLSLGVNGTDDGKSATITITDIDVVAP